MKSSQYSGFYKLGVEERQKEVAEFCHLTPDDLALLNTDSSLSLDVADHMVENVIGTFSLPMGVALNFVVNGKDYVIPMVLEEPSVVAAASNMAGLVRKTGGFLCSNTGSLMRAQIQAVGVADPHQARQRILRHKDELIERANGLDPMLVSVGGGVKDIEVHIVSSIAGIMVVTHLIVDTKDAMGANAVNTMAEGLAARIGELAGGRVFLRILSNLADKRLARATCRVRAEDIGGPDVVDGILLAYAFAEADPYRAVTHNKGIMNGISPVVVATGNDWRAIESGAHAYAARSGRYTSLTTWEKDANGDLVGTIELPMAVGLVGGATKVHPVARLAVRMLGVQSANELAEIIAAVGLSQNLGAIRALATDGIQKGHMSLHARTLAATAGARPDLIDRVAAQLVKEKNIRLERAQEIIKELEGK
ncbi:MAG: hydroxymethylglutaryl-CoA reductase, degradative [Rhodospirillaceae bacterium]|nr:hydroxymethylglutaryl-CoA reductase, degradative [Rhodospirillaceae bacterium]